MSRVLDRIERWGNRLPHPFNLFLLFALAVLLLSWIAHALGLAVTHPVTGKPIVAVNLLDRQGIQNIITKAVSNFTGFAFERSRVESVVILTSRSPAYTVV